jgi:hypothetical protein
VIGPGLLDWIRTLLLLRLVFVRFVVFFLGLVDCEVPFC